MDRIYLARCSSYDQAAVDLAVSQIFAGLQLPADLFLPGQKVFLKVNLLMKKKPEEAVTTHPAVVSAVARHFVERGLRVVIGDSPGGPFTPNLLKGIYRTTGMEKAAAQSGSELNYNVQSLTVANPHGRLIKSLTVCQAMWEADHLINLAKLKTHGMMVYTGAVKNLFGVVPGLLKAEYHLKMPEEKNFARLLVDICELIRPSLSIIDGIVAMDGAGPSGGSPFPMQVLLGGTNPYALDLLASQMIGLAQKDVPYLHDAGEAGLLPDLAEIEVVGEPWEKFQTGKFQIPPHQDVQFLKNKLPQWLGSGINKLLTPWPEFIHAKCTRCGICRDNCPPQVITMTESGPVADLSGCIRCFCCQELCPARAVAIKRPWLTRKIFKK